MTVVREVIIAAALNDANNKSSTLIPLAERTMERMTRIDLP